MLLAERPAKRGACVGMISKAEIRRILLQPVAADSYLTMIGQEHPSHAFLNRSTQGVYRRLVLMLKEFAVREYGDPASVRVLDWGAGKGHITYLLRQAGFSVTSCDVSSSAIDSTFGQDTPIIRDQNVDVVPLMHDWILPFESQSFDMVVSFGVLEHVPNDRESLKEIRRVLRKGGVFFFCFLPYWLSWTQKIAHLRGDFYHPHLYSNKLLEDLARSADFELGPTWHGQLFPKNSIPYSHGGEYLDRQLTFSTPLKYIATNLEGFMIA